MKKNIIVVLVAFILGIGLMYYYEKRTAKNNTAQIIALGGFNSLDAAEEVLKKYEYGLIKNDNEKYYVYLGIFNNDYLIKTMASDIEDNNISYYIKEINITDNFYNYLNDYENILVNTDDVKVIGKAGSILLDKYYRS